MSASTAHRSSSLVDAAPPKRHNACLSLSGPVNLPRLLYVGDVPVERSLHGSALVFRLLQGYPPGRLMVVEGNLWASKPERRLPGVAYKTFQVGWARPLYTRFSRPWTSWLVTGAKRRARFIAPLLNGFQPDGVLTVTHFCSWITAAEFALRRNLALHIVSHDECIECANVFEAVRGPMRRAFSRVYRQAANRFCVSPYMAEEFNQLYGIPGEVLYPSRAPEAKSFDAPPERVGQSLGSRGLVVAFGGSLTSTGVKRQLGWIASSLKARNGRLLLFGPFDPGHARASGLSSDNIVFRGMLNSEDFKRAIREEADVLLVPMDFEARGAANARMSFPSKLTDYTAVGLPLLITGPEYCSAVRWARENYPVAELVTTEDPGAYSAALDALLDPAHRVMLGEAALRKGDQFFSHVSAQCRFFDRLQSPCSSRN